jgi:Lrp/AsnC family transcriptional regulator for asnA, asnC and gidA
MDNGKRALDRIDLQIIRYLQDAPRASYATIARDLGVVSDATVKRRIDQLIADGVIVPAMIPDLYRLGFGSLALLGLRIDLARLDDIAETLCAYPETTWIVGTVGKFDLIVFVASQSVEELLHFTGQRVATIPGVRNVDTLIAPRLFKQLRDWRVPLDTVLGLTGAPLPANGLQKRDDATSPSDPTATKRAARNES